MDIQTSLHIYRVNGRNELSLPFVGRPWRQELAEVPRLRQRQHLAWMVQWTASLCDSSHSLKALQENTHNTQRHCLTYSAGYVDIAW